MGEKPEIMAVNLFNSGYNCAEAVFRAIIRELNLDPGEMVKVATPFGGGISGQGLMCGCLTGAAMAVGLAQGRREADLEAKNRCYTTVRQIFNEFETKFGTYLCRELSGVDFSTEEGRQQYAGSVHTRVCVPLVAWATRMALKELGKREQPASQP